MWKNIVEPGTTQMTIWRMCVVCWIIKATNTHSEYVVLIAFPLQQRLHERNSMLGYTYIACLVNFTIRAVVYMVTCFDPHLANFQAIILHRIN